MNNNKAMMMTTIVSMKPLLQFLAKTHVECANDEKRNDDRHKD